MQNCTAFPTITHFCSNFIPNKMARQQRSDSLSRGGNPNRDRVQRRGEETVSTAPGLTDMSLSLDGTMIAHHATSRPHAPMAMTGFVPSILLLRKTG
jgi:hypothetical protein